MFTTPTKGGDAPNSKGEIGIDDYYYKVYIFLFVDKSIMNWFSEPYIGMNQQPTCMNGARILFLSLSKC